MWEVGEILVVNNFCFSVRRNCASTIINLLPGTYVKTFLFAGRGHLMLAAMGVYSPEIKLFFCLLSDVFLNFMSYWVEVGGTYKCLEKCVQNFAYRKPEGTSPHCRVRHRWKNNIERDLEVIVCWMWTGFSWLKVVSVILSNGE